MKAWFKNIEEGNISPSLNDFIEKLNPIFPLLSELESTQQDAIWHAEGNCKTHTSLVVDEVYNLLKQHDIYGERRLVLLLSAILHDIAKPITTRTAIDNNDVERIVAKHHEEVGAGYLWSRILELPIRQEACLQIIRLVQLHQKPKFLVIDDATFADYLKLSLNVDMELLYLLAKADVLGRNCDDKIVLLEYIELFKLYAESEGLFNAKTNIESFFSRMSDNNLNTSEKDFVLTSGLYQLANKQIQVPEESYGKNFKNAKKYSNFYVMCGMSGSGKSTWIKNNLKDYEIISLDLIREELYGNRSINKEPRKIVDIAKNRLKIALAQKKNVVWDATNIRKEYRKMLMNIGYDYGALVTCIVFHLRQNTIKYGNINRTYAIPDDSLNNQFRSFQPPLDSEFHKMLYVTRT